MIRTCIHGIETYLPSEVVSNQDLARQFPDWSVERIASKTGIDQRHIAAAGECASDLAFAAASKLFERGICSPSDIDYVLLCTQSPDYLLPTTACLLQGRLGIPKHAGALDFNLGCSGYIYGLGMAQGLVATGQASNILLLTAETYSKHLDPQDRSSVTIFGDGAAATLIRAEDGEEEGAKPVYVYGTDGSGAAHLILRGGGMRERCPCSNPIDSQDNGRKSLWMNGPEIFHFTLQVVPSCVRELLSRAGKQMQDIDLFVFHQANSYMLEHIRKKLTIPEEKFYVALASCGNTVSSTIPIALKSALDEGRLKAGQQVVLVGFGVGLSWGATLLKWPELGAI